MAKDNLKVTVCLEQTIHKALKDTLQKISDEYKIQIESIHIGWVDVSSYENPRFLIRDFSESSFSNWS